MVEMQSVDEANLSLKDIYTFMKAMGENLDRKIDGVQSSTNELNVRIEEVNSQLVNDLRNIAAKQINDNQERKVQIDELSDVVTANKADADEEISVVKAKLGVQEGRMDNFETANRELRGKLDHASSQIHWQMLRIKELETAVHKGLQHGRGWNVEIEGIPVNVGDEPAQLQAAAIKIFTAINVPVETYEIDTVHRLPSSRNVPSKPTIVRFCSRKTVRLIHENKHKLKDLGQLEIEIAGLGDNSRIFINASQCSYYKMLAFNCRLLKRKGLISGVFTSKDGRLSIKTHDEDFIKISHETDLTQSFPMFREFNFDGIVRQ